MKDGWGTLRESRKNGWIEITPISVWYSKALCKERSEFNILIINVFLLFVF